MAKNKDTKYYEAIGRRKESVARVRLYPADKNAQISIFGEKLKAGDVLFNKKPIEKTYGSAADRAKYQFPLALTNTSDKFIISIVARGGGKSGQIDALVHGLARAIEKVDKEVYRPMLKKEGLLTRDPRIRERRKVGTGGKARRKKQSPKR